MKRIIFCSIIFVLIYFFSIMSNVFNKIDLDYSDFSTIPILHEGRIKPLDTFSRIYLTCIYGKDNINGMSAISWLSEVMFDQELACNRPVFYISNSGVLSTVGLVYRSNHLYSFVEVFKALECNIDYIQVLSKLKKTKRNIVQNQLVELHSKILWFLDISNIGSLILPRFIMYDKNLASKLGVEQGEKISYLDIIFYKDKIIDLSNNLSSEQGDFIYSCEKELTGLLNELRLILSKKPNMQSFCVIPCDQKNLFISLWDSVYDKNIKHFRLWSQLGQSYLYKDNDKWTGVCKNIGNLSCSVDKQLYLSIKLENLYNHLSFFFISGLFYFFVVVLGFFGIFLFKKNIFIYKFSYSFLFVGFLLHVSGLMFRVYITGRPPVATLYESIIFVGLISVFIVLFLEKIHKDSIGVIWGGLLGLGFQYIGSKYVSYEDTMGVLTSVLNTRFWLISHVITISIGYGCCFISSVLSHIYLIHRLFNPTRYRIHDLLFKNIISMSLIALFFSIVGTILGGVWADQSWGRFWGWDPKENGALLIVLWLLLLLHIKLAKLTSNFVFVLGVALTSVVVVIAWFGVNLLNIGFHSYGFDDYTGMYIGLFCVSEILFVFVIYFLCRDNIGGGGS